MKPAALTGLVDVFAGIPDEAMLADLLHDRDAAFEDRWSDRVRMLHASGRGDAGNVVARIDALPPAALRRLTGAPEMWSFATSGVAGADGDPLGTVAGWLDAEEFLAGMRSHVDAPTWTALGDVGLDPSSGRCVKTCAPHLAETIVIDWQSPSALSRLVEIHDDPIPFPSAEGAVAHAKIRDGFNLLERSSETWTALVERFARVVLVRNDRTTAAFSSATTRAALGRLVLRNPHHQHTTLEVLLDGLIHETVHTIVDHVELTVPLIARPLDIGHLAFRSPWTGRQLDPNTFVHAVMVWGSLFFFWLEAYRANAIDERTAIGLLWGRAGGFVANPSPANLLRSHGAAFAEGVIDVVDKMERRVRNVMEI